MTTRRVYQEPCSAFESLDVIRKKMLQQEFEPEFFEKFVLLFSPSRNVTTRYGAGRKVPAGEPSGNA